MRLFLIFSAFIFTSFLAKSKTFTSIADGNFDNPAIWDQGVVPSFDGDTMYIFHHIIYSRDSVNMGNIDCKVRPCIYVKPTAIVCVIGRHIIYNMYIEQVGGIMYFGETNYRGVEHQADSNSRIFYQTRFVVEQGGKFRCCSCGGWRKVEAVAFDCNSIPIDTEFYSTKCPKPVYYIEESKKNDSTVFYKLHSNITMMFDFKFPDTTIQKYSGDSFIYTRKKRDTFTVVINMTDYCDRKFIKSIRYDFRKNSSVSNSIYSAYNDNFELTYLDYSTISVKSADFHEYEIIVYNSNGQKLSREKFKSQATIQVDHLSKSIYFLYLVNENGQIVFSKKISPQ